MAAAIPFDTLAFVKELETAGVPAAQAEAHAKTLVSTFQKVEESRRMDFATKGDIEELKREREGLVTKGDVEELKREREGLSTKGDIADVRREIGDVRKDVDALRKDVGEIRREIVDLRRDMKELELRMVIKLGSMILVGVGLMITANHLWPVPAQYAPSSHSQERLVYPPSIPQPQR